MEKLNTKVFKALSLRCSRLSLYLMTVVVFALSANAVGDGAGPCPLCVMAFVDTRSFLPNGECDHGPDHDPHCKTPGQPGYATDCCEYQPGGCTGAADECSCFACGLPGAIDCEPAIQRLAPTCGIAGSGLCCIVATDPYQTVVELWRIRLLKEGETSCTPVSGYGTKVDCSGSAYRFGCQPAAGMCNEYGDWFQHVGTMKRRCDGDACYPHVP